jgi:uncharacterized membrane protein
MNPYIYEWLSLLVRWAHVFAGIMWIGQTYLFTWLDGRLTEEEKSAAGGEKAEVWMVHSGGFYVVEKQKKPGPRKLHWFRFEAAWTWLTGMLLLVLVYYLGGVLVDKDVLDISVGAATAFGLGSLVVAWIVYDLLLRSPLGKSEKLFALVGYLLIVGATFSLTRVLSGRAAYIHVGAIFGTIMAANVWLKILPAQRRMIAATKEGKLPDARLAAQAKMRSKHNTYMVVPLVFTMISNHFPVATYGDRNNWLILAGLILLGWVAAHFVRRA